MTDRCAQAASFDDRAACRYGEIRAFLEGKGKVIGAMDVLIAAHAGSLALTLVTNNLREFNRVPGLQLGKLGVTPLIA